MHHRVLRPLFIMVVMIMGLSTAHRLIGQDKPEPAAPGSVVEEFRAEVGKVRPMVQGEWTKSWVEQAGRLPAVEPKQIKLERRNIGR